MRRFVVLYAFLALLFACGDEPSSPDSPDGGNDAGGDLAELDAITADGGDAAIGLDADGGDAGALDAARDSDISDGNDARDVGGEDVNADADADATADADAASDTDAADIAVDGADGSGDAADASDVAADTTDPPPIACADIAPGEWDDGVTQLFDPGSVPQSETIFDLGIQSGAARPESILLWTHIADGFAKTLYVWRDADAESEVVLVHAEEVTPGPLGYTHVTVSGLAPCTWYRYAFFAGEAEDGFAARSTIGRFKTALPPGSLDIVRVGATSCTSGSTQPWEALSLTAEQDIDLLLHLGDQSYNDDAETLAEYRAEWRRTLNDPGYRALHAAVSHLTTWDDHEVTNNWNPETLSFARRRFATTAYFETLAVERGPGDRLWRSYRWGDTLEIWVTDSRSERLPSTRLTPEAQYWSPEQMAWVQDGLLNSDAHFKVVFSSVPITNMPGVWDLASEDRWEGYAADRSRLLDFITGNELENVWFLGGDFHVGFVAHVEPSGPANAIWEIAVGPGGNGPNPAALLLTAPQFDFKTDGFGSEFMTTLEFDPISDAVRVVFTTADGRPLYDEELRWGGR